MTNEVKVYPHTGGLVTIANANGPSTTNGAMSTAAGTYDLTALTPANYPDLELILTATLASASGTDGRTIDVHIRPLDVDGTTDVNAPTTGNRTGFVGAFQMLSSNASQVQRFVARDVPLKGEVYVFNDAGVTLSANWTLKALPVTKGPV